MLDYGVLAALCDPILDRVPIYRATHQVAALHEPIEGYADIQFANIAPLGDLELLKQLRSAGGLGVKTITFTSISACEPFSRPLSIALAGPKVIPNSL